MAAIQGARSVDRSALNQYAMKHPNVVTVEADIADVAAVDHLFD